MTVCFCPGQYWKQNSGKKFYQGKRDQTTVLSQLHHGNRLKCLTKKKTISALQRYERKRRSQSGWATDRITCMLSYRWGTLKKVVCHDIPTHNQSLNFDVLLFSLPECFAVPQLIVFWVLRPTTVLFHSGCAHPHPFQTRRQLFSAKS